MLFIHTAATRSPCITSHLNEEETVFPSTQTPLHHQNTGFTPTSEVINSPFNFEMHSDMIQQLNKSPGDGFLFQSRPMFDHSSVDKEREQVRCFKQHIRQRSIDFFHLTMIEFHSCYMKHIFKYFPTTFISSVILSMTM